MTSNKASEVPFSPEVRRRRALPPQDEWRPPTRTCSTKVLYQRLQTPTAATARKDFRSVDFVSSANGKTWLSTSRNNEREVMNFSRNASFGDTASASAGSLPTHASLNMQERKHRRVDWIMKGSESLLRPPCSRSMLRAMSASTSHLSELRPPRHLQPLDSSQLSSSTLALQSSLWVSRPSLLGVQPLQASRQSSQASPAMRRSRSRAHRPWDPPRAYECLHLGPPRSEDYYADVLGDRLPRAQREAIERRRREQQEAREAVMQQNSAATTLQAGYRGMITRKGRKRSELAQSVLDKVSHSIG